MKRIPGRNKALALAAFVLLACSTGACKDRATVVELEKYRAQAAVEQQNSVLVTRVFDELNKHNAAVYEELFAPEYGWHFPAGNLKALTREEEARFVKLLWDGFPDTHWDIEDMIASGEHVVVRFTFKGTHKGEYQGLPPTGNTVNCSGMWMARIRNGRVVAVRENADVLGWMEQLGMELKPKEPRKK
jgi:steroid delta-isomerase-like uncharacterized protein